jgi:preprotein translocase subunit SecA
MNTRSLRKPGLAFGRYAERREPAAHALGEFISVLHSRLGHRAPVALPPKMAAALQAQRQALADVDANADAGWQAARLQLAQALPRDGLAGEVAARALGLACLAMQRTLGLQPYASQQLAAWLILQGRMAEMATGEGKTVAVALAAAVAALAGRRVHVLTANDYLVQRDAQNLQPFYALLGLSCGGLVQATPAAQRPALYRRSVVYTTAKELGFDYLRDHHALAGTRDPRMRRALAIDGDAAEPVLPGLECAIVDEADSLLLDEACVPLILAAAGAPPDVTALQRAYDIAAALAPGRHYRLQPGLQQARLSDEGRSQVATAVGRARGLLWPLRRAHELVQTALVAQHLLRRGHEYIVDERGLSLVDELTGRVAAGRQWTGALHAMVELKEGLAPSPPSITAAQITYQRLFPRYLHLAGVSGTLHESRHELAHLYRCRSGRVPLARPLRRCWLGRRMLRDEAALWTAVVAAVRAHTAQGQPVLIGAGGVAASQRLSGCLTEAGITHQVLNALQDADEAQRVALAGQAGAVTVTTNMAGRGTDIQLDEAARAAGGLHVIVAVANRSRRIDRQLIGRSARHGDPGSAEALLSLDDTLLVRTWPAWLRRTAAAMGRQGDLPPWLSTLLVTGAQRAAEWADTRARLRLRRADRQANDSFAFSGTPE